MFSHVAQMLAFCPPLFTSLVDCRPLLLHQQDIFHILLPFDLHPTPLRPPRVDHPHLHIHGFFTLFYFYLSLSMSLFCPLMSSLVSHISQTCQHSTPSFSSVYSTHHLPSSFYVSHPRCVILCLALPLFPIVPSSNRGRNKSATSTLNLLITMKGNKRGFGVWSVVLLFVFFFGQQGPFAASLWTHGRLKFD